jgi:hypothetical protein
MPLDPFEPINKDEFKVDDLPENDNDLDDVNPEEVGLDDGLKLDDEDDLNLGDEEIDPVGDIGLDLGSGELDRGEKDLPDAISDDESESVQQPLAPEQVVKWHPVAMEDGEIRSEHVDGFTLRAKPLTVKKGEAIKYVAQLYKDKKMIEKGVIWVKQNEDPRTFLQNVADRMLSRMNLVNKSMEQPKQVDNNEEMTFDDEEIDLGEDEGLGDLEGEEPIGLGDLE